MSTLGSPERPLRAAVVGSGPAGFYVAAALFSAPHSVCVDLFERLPVPFGLVRAGVAPDHPKTKSVLRVFDKLANREGFSFLGNVTVGRDISIEELRAHYDVVVFATGAEVAADLGIPGERLSGSHSADEFVGWYNGNPELREARFDFSQKVAVVIGQGNVATDVVRMLALPADALKKTDVCAHALEALAESRVEDIYLIGRRGPVQAKFTQQELEELGEMADCDVVLDPADLALDPLSQAELDAPKNFNSKRNMPVFEGYAKRPAPTKRRRLHIRFLESPVEIVGHERVEGIVLEKNRLEGEPFRLKAQGTGVRETLPCGLVFRAVGHRGVAIPGVPFDTKRGVIPNEAGRVVENGVAIPGLYASGWIKRGATGLIGTNKADGIETVDRIVEDVASLSPCATPDSDAVRSVLAERGIRVISFEDWRRIDAVEVARGEAAGKPREKFTRIQEMLSAADEEVTI